MTVDISRKAAAAVSSVHAGVCPRPTEDLFQPPEFECVLLSWCSRSNKPNIGRLWRFSSQLSSTLSPLLAAAYTTHHKDAPLSLILTSFPRDVGAGRAAVSLSSVFLTSLRSVHPFQRSVR